MSARCYNCGNDPGHGDRCQMCGANLVPQSVGMFSTQPLSERAEPATDPTPSPHQWAAAGPDAPLASRWDHADREAGRPDVGDAAIDDGHGDLFDPEPADDGVGSSMRPWTGNHDDDIVDAAIVDDDGAGDAGWMDEPPTTEPFSYAGPPTANGSDPATSVPLGSIFDDVDDIGDQPLPHVAPAGADLDPARMGAPDDHHSPFGRHANDEPVADPIPSGPSHYSPYTPPPTPPTPPAGFGVNPNVSSAGRAEPFAPRPEAPRTVVPVVSDAHGLSNAVARLSPAAQSAGATCFTVCGALLVPQETVLGAVQGTSEDMPAVVVLTSSRLLVVAERRWTPRVETFVLRPGLEIQGRHVDGTATLTLFDGDRTIAVERIADVVAAVELANTTRAHASATGF